MARKFDLKINRKPHEYERIFFTYPFVAYAQTGGTDSRWFVVKFKNICQWLMLVFCIFFFSCGAENTVLFPVSGTSSALLSGSQPAREGLLDFSKQKKFGYRFDAGFYVPGNSSLEIEYEINQKPDTGGLYPIVLNMGSVSWQLPADLNGVRYAVPVQDTFNGHFNIVSEKKEALVLRIISVRFTDCWFGFNRNNDEYDLYTPFVKENNDGSYNISVPSAFIPNGYFAEIEAHFSGKRQAVMEFAGKKIETYNGNNLIFVPAVLLAKNTQSAEVILRAEGAYSLVLKPRVPPVFPRPVKADPAFVIYCQKENWRNKSYEVFRWDRFPSLLIFDFEDYAVQDKMLKRLAFFVEKAGFRGRLAPDSEIEELHGWNAHDYRAQDLATFFDSARKASFPLLGEERELEKILLNEGIIGESPAGITAGDGGIISISRESSDYLRYRFLTHEGFHGLFFIDADFRDFSRKRLEQLPAVAKQFIKSYFDFQQYDTKDEYLFVNEFMAHVLQQTDSQAADYFGSYLPLRLQSSWRAGALPKKDEASGTWPVLARAFAVEAEAFSAYVNRRWGLAAGRVWGLQIE
ncbi:MAG: hypothetical protein LBV17_12600 [Treponema sp.]|jgi:hypothetical protein|nr:hypothetical protein [Treponema sp.]